MKMRLYLLGPSALRDYRKEEVSQEGPGRWGGKEGADLLQLRPQEDCTAPALALPPCFLHPAQAEQYTRVHTLLTPEAASFPEGLTSFTVIIIIIYPVSNNNKVTEAEKIVVILLVSRK